MCRIPLCATDLYCCPNKHTSVSHTVALGSFITMITLTVVYFESCCCKYSQAHQTGFNPQLKLVPKECTIYLLLELLILRQNKNILRVLRVRYWLSATDIVGFSVFMEFNYLQNNFIL